MTENNTPNLSTITPSPAFLAEQARSQLMKSIRGSGSWFYWIAALSLINTIMYIANSDRTFIVGLGITQVFDGVATSIAQETGDQAGTMFRAIAIVLDLLVLALFVFLGVKAVKARTWAFMTGMVLYALDALLFLMVQDWLGLAFHAFVLVMLFTGLGKIKKLKQLDEAQPVSGPIFY